MMKKIMMMIDDGGNFGDIGNRDDICHKQRFCEIFTTRVEQSPKEHLSFFEDVF